jgi:hypothetical protein
MISLHTDKIYSRLKVLDRRPTWLAKEVGVSNVTVHGWLKGSYMPTYHHLEQIGQALGVDCRTLINVAGKAWIPGD